MNTELLTCLDDTARWLQVGSLIDGESETPIKNGHIVFNAESIIYVGANAPASSFVNGRINPKPLIASSSID